MNYSKSAPNYDLIYSEKDSAAENRRLVDLDIDSFFQIQIIETVRVTEFGWRWAEDIYVIPQYCLVVDASGGEIPLSREHTRFRWPSYEQVGRLLKYDGSPTALRERSQHLRGLGPRG